MYRASNELTLKDRPNRHWRHVTIEVFDGSGRKATVVKPIFLETARTCISDRNGQVVVRR